MAMLFHRRAEENQAILTTLPDEGVVDFLVLNTDIVGSGTDRKITGFSLVAYCHDRTSVKLGEFDRNRFNDQEALSQSIAEANRMVVKLLGRVGENFYPLHRPTLVHQHRFQTVAQGSASLGGY